MQAGSPTSTTDRDSDDQSSAPGAPRKRKKKPPARRTNAQGSTAGKSDTRSQRTQSAADSKSKAAESVDAPPTTPTSTPAKTTAKTAKPQQRKRTTRQTAPNVSDRPANEPTSPTGTAQAKSKAAKPPAATTSTGSGQQPAVKQRTSTKPPAATKTSASKTTADKTSTAKPKPPAKSAGSAKQSPATKRTRKVTAKKKPVTQASTTASAETQQPKTTPEAKQSTDARASKDNTRRKAAKPAAPATPTTSKGAPEAANGSSSTLTATRTTTATAAGAVTAERAEPTPNAAKTKRRAGTRKTSEATVPDDLPDALPFVDGDATASKKQQAEFAERLSGVDDASFSDRRVVPSSSHRVRLTSSNRRDQRPVLLVVALFTQLQLTLLALVAMVTGALHAIANVEDGVLNSLSIPERVSSLTAKADFGLTILLVSVAVSSFVVLALWARQLRSPDHYEVDWLTPALPGIAVWVVAAAAYLYLKLEIMGVDSEHWLAGEGVIGGLLPYLVLTVGALVGAISASQVRDPV